MPKPLHLYFVATAIVAGGFLAMLDWSALADFGGPEWAGFFTFTALSLLAQRLEVDSKVGSATPVKVSFAFLPLLAMGVVMPVIAVVMAAFIVTAINEAIFRERELGRGVFNCAVAVLTYGSASILYWNLLRIGGQPPDLERIDSITGIVIPFFGFTASLFALNFMLVSVGLALRYSERFFVVIREISGRGGGNLLYGLMAAPVALFTAYLYETLYVGGLLLVVLPLLLIRYTYLSTIQLQQANRDLLNVLVKTIETRDIYTSGHSKRVSELAAIIATDYGLRPSSVKHIETAALLHDIGKIDAEYASVISKPDELSDDERCLIQGHAARGADLLQTLTSLERPVITGVRHHHERYDGSGYPDGLRGKDIPLAGRIIMICDAVDAMLSDRPYRDAMPISEVRSELRRCAGSQFDPDIVDSILANSTLERAELLVDRVGARRSLRRPTPSLNLTVS